MRVLRQQGRRRYLNTANISCVNSIVLVSRAIDVIDRLKHRPTIRPYSGRRRSR